MKNIYFLPTRIEHFDEAGEMSNCPECNAELIARKETILLHVKSSIDEGDFFTNLCGSRFCDPCSIVVYDRSQLEMAAINGINGNKDISYHVVGLVDMDACRNDEENKRDHENRENRYHQEPVVNGEKIGRNDPCTCGSGKKYKKCCGK